MRAFMPSHDIPLPFPKPKANPGQIKIVDTRDDRLEFATLLNHLSPDRRVQFLSWACQQALLPGSRIHPAPAPSIKKLVAEARHCDNANERLTMAIILDLTHLSIDYAIDLRFCLNHLVLMARGKA